MIILVKIHLYTTKTGLVFLVIKSIKFCLAAWFLPSKLCNLTPYGLQSGHYTVAMASKVINILLWPSHNGVAVSLKWYLILLLLQWFHKILYIFYSIEKIRNAKVLMFTECWSKNRISFYIHIFTNFLTNQIVLMKETRKNEPTRDLAKVLWKLWTAFQLSKWKLKCEVKIDLVPLCIMSVKQIHWDNQFGLNEYFEHFCLKCSEKESQVNQKVFVSG